MTDKMFSIEEIRKIKELDSERVNLEVVGKTDEIVCIRKAATDWSGSFLLRLFVKKPDQQLYEEIDLKKTVADLASALLPNVNLKRLLESVLENLDACDFLELIERMKKKPKITVGVQKGSCMYLYIRGKRGRVFDLQLTE